MKRETRSESILRALCGEPGPDDGRPPARRSRSSSSRPDRKTWQLCAQAQRALEYSLGEVCPQLLQHTVSVQSVVPAPDATHLLVTVVVGQCPSPQELQRLQADLLHRQGRLRAAVATAITRRKAPLLTFRVVAEATEGARHE
jgi:ribosome-binding factor A